MSQQKMEVYENGKKIRDEVFDAPDLDNPVAHLEQRMDEIASIADQVNFEGANSIAALRSQMMTMQNALRKARKER